MLNYLFFKFVHFLAVRLPLRAGYAVSDFLSVLKYYISPRDRKAVAGNLKRLLPASEHRRLRKRSKEVFIYFGRYLIEFFRLSLLKKEDLGRLIKIKGLEHLDAALKKGKGVIIVSAHMGNWELGGVFMAILGYKIVGVALPHRSKKLNDLFNGMRRGRGMDVIPSTGPGLRKIYEALKENRIIALVGDRDFGSGGRRMDFLGATKMIPRGPAILSLRTGAPIVPGFMTRDENNVHHVEFLPSLPEGQDEERLMAAYTRAMEVNIRANPTQWLMFREFWKE